MIRLGSLAGYPFEGPRSLAGWTPPETAAVYAILVKKDPAKQEFAVVYVGHSDALNAEGFPFRHPRSAAWIKRAEGKFNISICWYEVPGGTRAHREQIARELIAVYEPSCNTEKFDQSWRDEWIGDFETPIHDPLTTQRDPS